MSATYPELEAACDQLKRSERGRRTLKNLARFFREGGVGLDSENQEAAAKLILAAFENPWDLPAHLMVETEGK